MFLAIGFGEILSLRQAAVSFDGLEIEFGVV